MKILNLKTLSFWGIVSLLIGGAPASAGVRYLHGDHLGSASLASDVNGTIVESAAYSPFGELLSEKGKGSPLSHLYTSQELDRSTDLYYYGARYYDPALGRFLSLDPLKDSEVPRRNEDPERLNRYSYTKSNPVIYIDPNGKFEVWFHYLVTMVVAIMLGYSEEEAAEIAYFAVRVDYLWSKLSDNFSPLPIVGVPSVHFPGAWSIFSFLYNRKIAALSKNQRLGLLAHQAQDHVAHSNFHLGGLFEPVIQFIQHWVLGKWFYPDDPARRPDDVRRAAEETIQMFLDNDPRFENLTPEEKKRIQEGVMQGLEEAGLFNKDNLAALRSMYDFFNWIKQQDLSPDEQKLVFKIMYEQIRQLLPKPPPEETSPTASA